MVDISNHLINKNYILGSDEVGYGCWAGPLVVCGVKAPKEWTMAGLRDSKKLSPARRESLRDKLIDLIKNNEIQFHIAERSNTEIDARGLGVTLKNAYVEIFKSLYQSDCLIITDGILKFDNLGVDDYDKISLVKADDQIPTVMAASILAKTYRDQLMRNYHQAYPIYNFIKNVGYGTKDHQEALAKHGPCNLHRFSYEPIKKLIKE